MFRQKLNHFWSAFLKKLTFFIYLGWWLCISAYNSVFLPILAKNCSNLVKYGTVRKIFSRAIIWAQFRHSSSNNSVVIPAYSWSLQPEFSQFQSFDVFSCFSDILVKNQQNIKNFGTIEEEFSRAFIQTQFRFPSSNILEVTLD